MAVGSCLLAGCLQVVPAAGTRVPETAGARVSIEPGLPRPEALYAAS